MGRFVNLLVNPLLWKLMVIILGVGFSLVNLTVDPNDLITLPEGEGELHGSGIKAAGFAIITAISLFAGSIPTGQGKFHRLVDASSRMLGILATLGAGWFWLHGETHGYPGKYLYGVLILTIAAAVTVLIWGGIYALLALLAHGVSTVLKDFFGSLSRAARIALNVQRKR